MLDSDLAELYNVETKRVNEAVRNNSSKFPSRYSFILEEDEKDLQKRFKDMSKIVISKNPIDKIYDCLSYDEDKDSTLMQIIFSYASVMELSTEKVDCKSIKKIIRLSKNYHELQKLSRR